jgi:hypothetical protein
MLVELATAKKVMLHHAPDKQKDDYCQHHDKQKPSNSEPRRIRPLRIHLVPILRHMFFLVSSIFI